MEHLKAFRWVLIGGVGVCLSSACSSGASQKSADESSASTLLVYGVGWVGDIQAALSTEALLVDACVNGKPCKSQVVLIAGRAPASRWTDYEPPTAPTGAPRSSAILPVTAGTCRSIYDWDDTIGTSACATVGTSDSKEVQIEFFLDLSVVKDELQTGDKASIAVKGEADRSLLAEQTDTVDVPAPYYQILSLTGAQQ
jgi:hypothetical protein